MAGSSGFRGTTSLLLIVAVAATGGFLYWVYQQAQSTESSLQPAMQDTTSARSRPITPGLLAVDPTSAVGRDGVLDSIEVGASLGRGVFTVNTSDSTAFPVLMSTEMIGRGATVYQGDRVTVGGRFYMLNDSIRNEWVSRGAVEQGNEGQLPASAAFLLADSLNIHS